MSGMTRFLESAFWEKQPQCDAMRQTPDTKRFRKVQFRISGSIENRVVPAAQN